MTSPTQAETPTEPQDSLSGVSQTTPVRPVVFLLVLRSIVAISRVPGAIGPILIMPVFFMVAFSGSYSAITKIPGFPTDNIMDWFVPYACLQGAAFSGIGVGYATARDLETGFYDRLRLAPVNRIALILGPVGTSMSRATFPLFTVLPLGLLLDASFPGWRGLLILAAACQLLGISTGLWALGLVYRFQSQRMMGLVQIGIFTALFLSIGQVPLAVMDGWLHSAARINPTTNILRMARQGFLNHEVTWTLTWPGLVAGFTIIGALSIWTYIGFRKLDS